MLIVDSLHLPYSKIQYKNNQLNISQTKANWNLTGTEFLSTTRINIAYLVLHEHKVDTNHIEDIRKNFARQLKEQNVGTPKWLATVPLDLRTLDTGLLAGLRVAEAQKANLVVLVLSSKNQDTYSLFKYFADRLFGIPSIVMVETSNIKGKGWNKTGLDQYIGNIMMKANLKMGVINQSAVSSKGNIEKYLTDTLVLDSDVTHPSNGALFGCPSVAALVGSVEKTGGRFLGSLSLQSGGSKEVSTKQYLQYTS